MNTLFITFTLLTFFISENVYAQQKWDRKGMTVDYDQKLRVINIRLIYMDYEFGPQGEHGYWENVKISFIGASNSYISLFEGKVKDQVKSFMAAIRVSSKFPLAKIRFDKCFYPINGELWPEDRNLTVYSYTNYKKVYLTLAWELHPSEKVNSILLTGSWHVNGLNCNDEVSGQVFEINDQQTDNPGNEVTPSQPNVVNVHKGDGAIFVKGVEPGDNIMVYTTIGSLVKSLNANSDLVQIKLPANRLYLLRVAEACYRIAL